MRAWLEKSLPTLWYRHSRWHLLLVPLSGIFWVLSTLRRTAYQSGILRSYRLPVPVIVVGNISVGGTGKTPLVIWIAEQLLQKGWSPGIISRGYGGQVGATMSVNAMSNPHQVGDEPLLLAKRCQCPVWIGRNRVLAAESLLAVHPQCNVIISDDGLQHYRLRRNMEIVVVDGQRGFGNRWLLPAGPLRETVSRLKSVDAIVVNGDGAADIASYNMHLESGVFRQLGHPESIVTADYFLQQAKTGTTIYAVAGIGHPARFFQQLRQMGLVFTERAFADHHPFQSDDLPMAGADMVIMTEKDAVKCAAFAQPNWWYLPVSAILEQPLIDSILYKLGN